MIALNDNVIFRYRKTRILVEPLTEFLDESALDQWIVCARKPLKWFTGGSITISFQVLIVNMHTIISRIIR